jgi:hypothetical protein
VLTAAAGIAFSALWTRDVREEGEAIGTLVGVAGGLGVNEVSPPPVNAKSDDAPARELLRPVDHAALVARSFGGPCPVSVPSCTNHWDELSGVQQREVTALFARIVERNLGKLPGRVLVRAGIDQPVTDVVTDGSSLTKNYYDQFHRMLTTPEQGYAFLLRKLEAKAARR